MTEVGYDQDVCSWVEAEAQAEGLTSQAPAGRPSRVQGSEAQKAGGQQERRGAGYPQGAEKSASKSRPPGHSASLWKRPSLQMLAILFLPK